jgi:hypothetical protein
MGVEPEAVDTDDAPLHGLTASCRSTAVIAFDEFAGIDSETISMED